MTQKVEFLLSVRLVSDIHLSKGSVQMPYIEVLLSLMSRDNLVLMWISQRKSSPTNGRNCPGGRLLSVLFLGSIIPDTSAKIMRLLFILLSASLLFLTSTLYSNAYEYGFLVVIATKPLP